MFLETYLLDAYLLAKGLDCFNIPYPEPEKIKKICSLVLICVSKLNLSCDPPKRTMNKKCVGGRMLLQGDLQKIFDALYHLGVIDPVLEMDWSLEFEKIEREPLKLARLVGVVNSNVGDYLDLMGQLSDFEKEDLGHLAMVVARELVGFHTNEVIH